MRERLNEQTLDAVLICAPPTVRLEPIREAAERSIPYFCEKPSAFSLKEAKRIRRILQKTLVINSVGFMWQYHRIVDRAKELIKGCAISLMRSVLLDNAALTSDLPRWFLLKEPSGGPLVDQAIRLLDAARYVLGDIAYVQTFANNLVLPKT
jgi:myo-inositol 2-dehydrogenase/D-chiro-inositol 1-dehydrogenase